MKHQIIQMSLTNEETGNTKISGHILPPLTPKMEAYFKADRYIKTEEEEEFCVQGRIVDHYSFIISAEIIFDLDDGHDIKQIQLDYPVGSIFKVTGYYSISSEKVYLYEPESELLGDELKNLLQGFFENN